MAYEYRKPDDTVDCRTNRQKFNDFKARVKDGAQTAWTFIKEHPVEIAVGVATATAAIRQGRLVYDRVREAAIERENRLTIWCPDVSGKVRLKHELNYKELRELRDRMDLGQTKFEALDEMGLIK